MNKLPFSAVHIGRGSDPNKNNKWGPALNQIISEPRHCTLYYKQAAVLTNRARQKLTSFFLGIRIRNEDLSPEPDPQQRLSPEPERKKSDPH